MSVRQVVAERWSVVSARPFSEVLAVIDAAIGHPAPQRLQQAVASATTYQEMEAAVQPLAGETGLMLFLRLNLGEAIYKGKPGAPRQSQRLLVGNPLIMRRMAERVPDAGSYAPVTILIDERPDGVHLSYDRMASLLAPYGDAEALAVAHELDDKVEALLSKASGTV